MKQKRKEREEKEKADQLERERQRIQSGKELSIIKKKLEDEQLKKMAEERRREKEEEKKARQRVKDMIEQDKLARKQKFATSSPDAPVSSAAATPSAPMPASSPSSGQPKEYKETRIQIRYLFNSYYLDMELPFVHEVYISKTAGLQTGRP